ncbi:MAG: family 16 glycoside hydrolase [Verrucomicrobiota bacterium]
MKKIIAATLLALAVLCNQSSPASAADWRTLFNGQDLRGWKAGENPGSFRVVDGTIACDGPRAHLFYVGEGADGQLKNFELDVEVMTRPGANSGVYFHTVFQDKGWPDQGLEVQVNNSQPPQGGYYETKKTGSLYGIRNQSKSIVRDNEWFRMNILVRERHVQIRLNGTLVVDYVEPKEAVVPSEYPGRRLGHGTIALQCHDDESKAFYRNLRVRALPDSTSELVEEPRVDQAYRQVIEMESANFPVLNSHVHLKGGLTLEQALARSRETGIFYGIAVNCGRGFGVTNDAGIYQYLASMKGQPAFMAMQAEGREWTQMFSRQAIGQFDYIFTDSMTYTDDRGRRMRLWIKDEVFVDDKQAFVETLVDRAVGILKNEPIDIYVNPTFLPEVIASEYDALWTEPRMKRVIDAAVQSGIAIEINARYRLPSPKFIKLAKQAGAKFSFGTNNVDRNVGDLDYCLQMVKECGLVWQDMFVPRMDGPRARRLQ